MILKNLSLQHFRNYTLQNFIFSPDITVVLGPNTAGKTNLLDSIHLLSTGKSFLSDKEDELVRFGEEFARIKGAVCEGANGELQMANGKDEMTTLEVLLTKDTPAHRAGKRFFVNGIAKRRVDFATHLPVLLFTPADLDIISGSPSHRRSFLDHVLEQTDRNYASSLLIYIKALRQRNALIEEVQETGRRDEDRFAYWDDMLIEQGKYIHEARAEFINFLNASEKTIIECGATYDHSVVSRERLDQYARAEVGSGVTLVGPHRDEIAISLQRDNGEGQRVESREVKAFASRGQQRLVVLQLKLLQLRYMTECLQQAPLLLLDDIFSELDDGHIALVSQMVHGQQTIISTTHEEFIDEKLRKTADVIELEKNF